MCIHEMFTFKFLIVDINFKSINKREKIKYLHSAHTHIPNTNKSNRKYTNKSERNS